MFMILLSLAHKNRSNLIDQSVKTGRNYWKSITVLSHKRRECSCHTSGENVVGCYSKSNDQRKSTQ